MQKRTFSISHITLEKLYEISEVFHINKATLARIAIYHGMEKVKNGYLPVRNHHKKHKEKYEISLPEVTWREFGIMMNDIEYKLVEHIPDGEMIEIFMEIELKKFANILDEYEKKLDADNLYSPSDYEAVTINAEIPILLFEKLQNTQESIGIKQTQLGKYITVCGAIHEYTQQEFDTIDTDLDLLNEIQVLGLDRIKTLTLIRYLIKNNRIVWKDRE